MADLIVYAAVLGGFVTLILVGVSILLALVFRRIVRRWDIVEISTISSAFGPLLAIAFLIWLSVELSWDDAGLSGPEAQGIIVSVVVSFIVIGPGWWLGYLAIRRALSKTEPS